MTLYRKQPVNNILHCLQIFYIFTILNILIYLPLARRLCNARHLSVCLLATLRKNHEQIFAKILQLMHLWKRKNCRHFVSHLHPDLDQGNFIQHCETRHFPIIWIVSLEKKWLGYMKILPQMYG